MSWLMFHHDRKHTGRGEVHEAIYVINLDGYFYAFNPDGTVKWRYKAVKGQESSPAISTRGILYVGGGYYLYAINPNGSLKWSYLTDGDVIPSPAIGADGTIYVGSWDKYLYAIKPDGTLKWRYLADGKFSSSPTIAPDGTIYVGNGDGRLYAIKPDGTLKWRYETENIITYSSPAVADDGTIYIGSFDKYLYAIKPDGTLKWRYLTDGIIESSPAIANDGTIYVGGEDGYLYAINPDGTLKWRCMLSSVYILSSPAIANDGTIYVGCANTYLYAVNPDGTLKWSYKTDGSVDSSPAIAPDGTIYVGSEDGRLYAINPDGSLKWRYYTGDIIYSSPAVGKHVKYHVETVYDIFRLADGIKRAYKGRPIKVSDYIVFKDLTKVGYTLTGKKVFRVYYLPLEYRAIWDIMMAEEHNTKIEICKNFINLIKRVVDKLGVQPPYWNEKRELMEMLIKEMKYVSNYPVPPYIVLAEHTNKFVDYVCAEWTNALSLTKEIYELFKQKTGKTLPYVENLIKKAEKNAGNLQKYKFGDKISVKDHNLVIDTLKYLEVALLIVEDNI